MNKRWLVGRTGSRLLSPAEKKHIPDLDKSPRTGWTDIKCRAVQNTTLQRDFPTNTPGFSDDTRYHALLTPADSIYVCQTLSFSKVSKVQLHEQDGVEMLDTKEGSSSSQLHLRRINQKYSLIAFLLVLCTYIMCKRQLNTTEELNFSLSVCLLSLLSKQSPQKPACKSITLVGRITEEVVGETMMANDSGVWQSLNKRE